MRLRISSGTRSKWRRRLMRRMAEVETEDVVEEVEKKAKGGGPWSIQ